MEFNVVWDIEGNREIYPKGENHTITNNVAWDDDDQVGNSIGSYFGLKIGQKLDLQTA